MVMVMILVVVVGSVRVCVNDSGGGNSVSDSGGGRSAGGVCAS